jgi:type I restriction enzyme, S subunit
MSDDSMSEQKTGLVPRLRFPEYVGKPLPRVQIKDVTAESAERIGGKLSAMPVMGVSKVDGIVPMEERLISSDIARYKIVRKNWFAYNPMRLNIGSIARWDGEQDILVSPDYVVFKCLNDADRQIDPEYLDHFRQSDAWKQFVTEGGDGGVRVRIYYRDLALVRLLLPDRDEQEKIAACLSSLDTLIAAHTDKLAALRNHKKGLMQQLFPREGETVPRLRFPEFREAGEWVEKKFDGLIEVASGQVDPASSPYCDLPHVGSDNIESDTGILRSVKTARELQLISGKYAFDESFILYSKIRPALNKVARPHFKGICSADIYPIRSISADLVQDYLFYLLLSKAFVNYAKKHSDRGKIPKVNRDALMAYTVLLPPPAEQRRITASFSSLDTLIAAQADKLAALKTHKKGLMQQLFPAVSQAAP